MYYAKNYFYWCLAKYIHAGLQGKFFKKSPLATFNLKMVAIKQITEQTKKTHIKGSIFHAALLKVFGKPDGMIAKLSFLNLIYSIPCGLKDCNNGQESDNEWNWCLEVETICCKVAET